MDQETKISSRSPRGLFYCQPVLGSGHLMRSLYLSRALIQFFDIDFFYGGSGSLPFVLPPPFQLLQLPPLHIKDDSSLKTLVDPTGLTTVEEVFLKRALFLRKRADVFYDFIITEMYPFSKAVFGDEVDKILAAAKRVNPRCQVICSFKGISLSFPPEEELFILKKIHADYDLILSHTDPHLFRFEHFFLSTAAIMEKVFYTGFVSNPAPLQNPLRKKQIVVTFGGGAYGEVLPLAISRVVPFFPDYKFIFALGPKAPDHLKKELANLKYPNMEVTSFLVDFYKVLEESALSISLGGSTLIDTVKTKTPALVYPDINKEHFLRAKLFYDWGALQVIRHADLTPNRLQAIIKKVLMSPYNPRAIEVSGAEQSTLRIRKLLGLT